MAQSAFAYDEEILVFNQSQSAKIIDIKKRRRERENARKRAFEQFKALVFCIAIVLFFASLFGSIIYQNSKVSEAKYDIFNLNAEIKSLHSKIDELHSKIENQTELSYIEKIALEKLNMQYPTQEQMVYIEATYYYTLPTNTTKASDEAGEKLTLQP